MTVRSRERGRRRRRAVLWVVLAGLLVLAFGLGVAVGEALHDNPQPGGDATVIRTVSPQPLRRP